MLPTKFPRFLFEYHGKPEQQDENECSVFRRKRRKIINMKMERYGVNVRETALQPRENPSNLKMIHAKIGLFGSTDSAEKALEEKKT